MQPAIILKTPLRKYFEEKWTKTYQNRSEFTGSNVEPAWGGASAVCVGCVVQKVVAVRGVRCVARQLCTYVRSEAIPACGLTSLHGRTGCYTYQQQHSTRVCTFTWCTVLWCISCTCTVHCPILYTGPDDMSFDFLFFFHLYFHQLFIRLSSSICNLFGFYIVSFFI